MLKLTKVRKRQRGTAIVDTDAGILLVSGNGQRFSLPGGGVEKQESLAVTAARELHEETGLQATAAYYLFKHIGSIRKRSAGLMRNHHQVFLVDAIGIPKPEQEIKAIRFYQVGDCVTITGSARAILDKYLDMKQRGLIAQLRAKDALTQLS